MKPQTQYRLNDHTALPVLGFGTNVLKGDPGIQAIKTALKAGYRLIDTAQSYGNEGEVGQAIAESNLPRDDVFVTTKISDDNQGFQQTLDSVKVSLEKLQMETVDLLLVHWPNIEDFDRSIRHLPGTDRSGRTGKSKHNRREQLHPRTDPEDHRRDPCGAGCQPGGIPSLPVSARPFTIL